MVKKKKKKLCFSFYFSERKVGFLIRMAEVQVRVKHNIATYDLALSQEETLGMLAQKLMDLTGGYLKLVEVFVFIICYTSFTLGVPVSGQKMICSGKQLNTGDGWLERTIQEVRKTWTEKTYLGEKKLVLARKNLS